jgi:hypothetical protein
MANTIAKSLRFELKVYGLTVQLSVFFYFFYFFIFFASAAERRLAEGKQCAGFFQGIPSTNQNLDLNIKKKKKPNRTLIWAFLLHL